MMTQQQLQQHLAAYKAAQQQLLVHPAVGTSCGEQEPTKM
jgi:hypothetical protein